MGETIKAKARREKEGWFSTYAPADKRGIDLGCQHDPLHETYRKWDVIFGDGDATYMEGVEDNSYEIVYASHILEHLDKPIVGIRNWYRILVPQGHLIILVPHRDLYEKKLQPPSNWNHEHKTFWLPDSEDPPLTYNLRKVIQEAVPDAEIVSYKVLNDGYIPKPQLEHSVGEYSIEAIIRKP